MSIEELSNEFEVLANSYSTVFPFGNTANPLNFNEYEKSVFLSKAQEDYVLNLYTGKNVYKDSFEKTEESRQYLAPLILTKVVEPIDTEEEAISDKSVFFEKPDNVWFITYESVLLGDNIGCLSNTSLPVIPATQDEWHRLKKNPFRGSNVRRALRFDAGKNIVEIVCEYPVISYKLRFIKRPSPIILVDLSNTDLDIDGNKEPSTGDLELLHDKILEIAVRMAINSRIPNTSNDNNN